MAGKKPAKVNYGNKVKQDDRPGKATLYVARVKYRDNKTKKAIWAESKPCSGCQKAIDSHGIKSVVHTHSEGYKYM